MYTFVFARPCWKSNGGTAKVAAVVTKNSSCYGPASCILIMAAMFSSTDGSGFLLFRTPFASIYIMLHHFALYIPLNHHVPQGVGGGYSDPSLSVLGHLVDDIHKLRPSQENTAVHLPMLESEMTQAQARKTGKKDLHLIILCKNVLFTMVQIYIEILH